LRCKNASSRISTKMLSSSIVMTKANEYYENFSRKLTRNDEVLTDEKAPLHPF
jgi:hypothetical protein